MPTGHENRESTVKMSGELVCIREFEEHAHQVLPRNALDYYRSGAGQQNTLVYNNKAFSKYYEDESKN
ncbi:hypothetical protein NQ318_020040 [Aromia moschata]|uniref:Uncharacterized protein n=1 Tax=Aromia moschata TaxID=1265417 RepID=A0AAV8Z909_9CUCU|nr:hypothetical protein NQ318_020040 [Aromia moschata]